MKSLFGKLIDLHSDDRRRLEDFHTEIVARVLAKNPELTLAWLRELKVTELNEADTITVTTQVWFAAIPDRHEVRSRIDIVIRIRKGEYVEVVFIESKVGSSAGVGQLSRYMDHVRAHQNANRRTLIFITRDYESVQDLVGSVDFKATRWSQFHRFLSAIKSPNDTICELLQFMKENNMSQSNQFTAIDLVALTNYRHARSVVERTLADIAARFRSETGDLVEKKEQSRCTIESYPSTDKEIWYELGYWFPDSHPSESPQVGMTIWVKPQARRVGEIAVAMRKFCEGCKTGNSKWEHFDYSDRDNWERIECTRRLHEFMATKDHVAEIKMWLGKLLDDAALFQKLNPEFFPVPEILPL